MNLPDMPPRIAKLPRNHAGYPVPWFVAWLDGQPDFRIVGEGRIEDAIRFRKCWLCGGNLGANATFVIGPMCAVNRVSPEPPSHRDCAHYAAQACPFLSRPEMRRREGQIPDGWVEPDGIMIKRNPGVALVWTTRNWTMIPDHRLFDVGKPTEVNWYARGRAATRTEVLEAIESGLPILRDAAAGDANPRAALRILAEQYGAALELVPAEDGEQA